MLKDRHLVLVGFMGSGKTTVGGLLAEKLGRPFTDLDDRIRAMSGMTIGEYFDRHGEESFRRLEIRTLKEALDEPPNVIAVGGGTFASPGNRETIHERALSVWLDVPYRIAADRCLGDPERPLARDARRFRQLYEDRCPLYAEADRRVDAATGTPQEIAQRILRSVIARGNDPSNPA